MKRQMFLAAMVLVAGVASAQTNTYTMAQVATHSTATDCWYVLNTNNVYNFSPFLSIHPAGANIMLPYCGKDGTAGFASFGHSSHAVALEATYLIGTLVAAPAAITVSLTPTTASLAVGATEQFTPKVANSSLGVSFTVTPATLGTISASGLFTALAAGQGTITAASIQDAMKTASAVVTVSSNTPPPPNMIVVTVTPTAMTLNTGAKAQFKAVATNSTQGVKWSTTGSIGTIDANGLFTAAMVPGTGTVKATSVADPTKLASAQVTLTAVTCVPPSDDDHHHGGGGD